LGLQDPLLRCALAFDALQLTGNHWLFDWFWQVLLLSPNMRLTVDTYFWIKEGSSHDFVILFLVLVILVLGDVCCAVLLGWCEAVSP
jgi:hypothetical protein